MGAKKRMLRATAKCSFPRFGATFSTEGPPRSAALRSRMVDPQEGSSDTRDAAPDCVQFTRLTGLETGAPAERSIIAISAAIRPSAYQHGGDPSGSRIGRQRRASSSTSRPPGRDQKGLLEVMTELKCRAGADQRVPYDRGPRGRAPDRARGMSVSDGSVKSTRDGRWANRIRGHPTALWKIPSILVCGGVTLECLRGGIRHATRRGETCTCRSCNDARE